MLCHIAVEIRFLLIPIKLTWNMNEKPLLSRQRSANDLCPCHSTLQYKDCCKPIIAGVTKAETPEILMRSRYSAYVLKNSSYLLSSWDPTTRPSHVIAPDVQWLNLTIHRVSDIHHSDTHGTVDYSVLLLENDTLVTLHEVSNFIKSHGVWLYKDGESKTTQKKVCGKDNCPCGSNKKFKRCCKK